MFGIGTPELILILIVALIVIGPSKLPEMARALGKAMGEFRRVTNDVKHTIEMEAEHAEQKARAEAARKEMYPEEKPEAKPAQDQATTTEQAETVNSEMSASQADASKGEKA